MNFPALFTHIQNETCRFSWGNRAFFFWAAYRRSYTKNTASREPSLEVSASTGEQPRLFVHQGPQKDPLLRNGAAKSGTASLRNGKT